MGNSPSCINEQSQISQLEVDNDNLNSKISQLNDDIDSHKQCEEKNDALIIALNRYQSATGFVKTLFNNGNWLMYVVNDFDKNWKDNKYYKYIWNIAFIFKNTTKAIIIYGARNSTASPVSSPAIFKSINKGFIDALAVDSQLTAYNMEKVITNPLLALKYKISFWGAYKQKTGDVGDGYVKVLENDQGGDKRNDSLNQTAWMWNWINTSVYNPNDPKVKANANDVTAFKDRIVGTVTADETKHNATPKQSKVDTYYNKRPTAAGK